MVAFADLAINDMIQFKASGKRLEFRLDEKLELDIVGGGTQVRFDMHRPLSVTGSMLLRDELPGKKPVLSFAWGVFQLPLEDNGRLGSQLTFREQGVYPLRKGSTRELRIKGSSFVQQLYDMPGGKTMLAERWTPKLGRPSNHYFRLFTLTEADIRRV